MHGVGRVNITRFYNEISIFNEKQAFLALFVKHLILFTW